MKYFVCYCTLAALLLFAPVAQAQVSFGPRVGASLTHFAYEWHGYGQSMDTKALVGAQLGVALNAQFGKWAVQPTLLFSMKGDRRIEQRYGTMTLRDEAEHTIRYNYAELPINVVFSTKGDKGGFQVFAGPYFAYGLYGQYTIKQTWLTQLAQTGGVTYKQDVKFATRQGEDRSKSYAQRLDAGLNVGLGYKVGPLQAQLGYGLGLHNLFPRTPSGKEPIIEQYNRSLQLSLAYFFLAECLRR